MAFRSAFSKLQILKNQYRKPNFPLSRSLSSPSSPKTPIIENPPSKAPICLAFNAKGEPDVDPYHELRAGYHYEKANPFKEGSLFIKCSSAFVRQICKSPLINNGAFVAAAYQTADGSSDCIGIVNGIRSFNDIENLELYAVRQGLILEEKLRKLDLHNGPSKVVSTLPLSPNVFEQSEVMIRFTDLCFADDDVIDAAAEGTRHTTYTYVGDEIKNAPSHLLELVAEVKDAIAYAEGSR